MRAKKQISACRIIGSSFTLEASSQGSRKGKSYTLKAADGILLSGNPDIRNQKASKVYPISMKNDFALIDAEGFEKDE